MTPGRQPTHTAGAVQTIALASIMIAATASGALARDMWPHRPPLGMERSAPSYAGDCGPNPPPGYRFDSRNWRTGFNRDFYCYMLDEY